MKKLFGTDGIRGKVNEYPIVPEIVLRLGAALAQSFEKPKIIIGKDTRSSGYIFEYSLAAGICAAGGDVLFVGVLPTPAIAYLTKKLKANAGIVVTASHNPATDNGIKIFSSDGYKLSDKKEENLEQMMFSEMNLARKAGKAYRIKDARESYVEFAKQIIGKINLEGIKIVLDCANGASYKIAPKILRELGAEIIVLNNKPDGFNINKDCGALHAKKLKKYVIQNNADIGIALDGDADRIIVADEKGDIHDGDQLMYICAKNLLKNNNLKDKRLIATVMSNEGFVQSLKKEDIEVMRCRVGDHYVIEKMKELDANFGGEQSGHIIFSDYTTTGDGIICGLFLLKIMKKTKKKLSELSHGLEVFPQKLINILIKEKRDFTEMPLVLDSMKNAEEILGDNGRVLIRYSGTENKARVMVEGKEIGLVEKFSEEIASEIRKEIGID